MAATGTRSSLLLVISIMTEITSNSNRYPARRRGDLPQQVWLWPPACGFGHWGEAHPFWRAMPPFLWLSLAGRDLRR